MLQRCYLIRGNIHEAQRSEKRKKKKQREEKKWREKRMRERERQKDIKQASMERNSSASNGFSRPKSHRNYGLMSRDSSAASFQGDPASSCADKRMLRVTKEKVTIAPYHDGYEWRKYGQKSIIGIPFPRCYYRCTYKEEQGCPARKQVQQQNNDDPPLFTVTYKNEHTCNNVYATSSYQVMEQCHPTEQQPRKPFLLHFDSRYDSCEVMKQERQQQYLQPTLSLETMPPTRTKDISTTERRDNCSPGLMGVTTTEVAQPAIISEAPDEQYSFCWDECPTPESLCFDTGCVVAVDSLLYCEPDHGEDTFYPLALW